MSRIPLTERQKTVLRLICEALHKSGMAPSLRALAFALGGMSVNGVVTHLNALERKGYIRREAYTANGIRLAKHGDLDAWFREEADRRKFQAEGRA